LGREGDITALGFETSLFNPQQIKSSNNAIKFTAPENLDTGDTITFILTEQGAKELNSVLEKTDLQKQVIVILKRFLNIQYAGGDKIFKPSSGARGRNIYSKEFGKHMISTLLKLICYVNYTSEFQKDYTYTLTKDNIETIVTNFNTKFLAEKYQLNESIPETEINFAAVKNGIYEKVFNLKSDYTYIINVAPFKYYASPVMTCLQHIIYTINPEYINKVSADAQEIVKQLRTQSYYHIVLFIVKFTEFTLKQGGEIVSSLDHLLYKFLKQIPEGIPEYNNNNKNAQFITNYSHTSKKQQIKDEDEFNSTGMTEMVTRKYCQGMDTILGLDEDTDTLRFLNLLAIVRNDKINDEASKLKRCQGAIDTVKFGKTLIQAAENPVCGRGQTVSTDAGVTENKASKEEIKNARKELEEAFRDKSNLDDKLQNEIEKALN